MRLFRNFGLVASVALAACSSTSNQWRQRQSEQLGFRAEAIARDTWRAAAFDEWYWRSQYFTYDPYYGALGAGIWQDPWFRWDPYGRFSVNRFTGAYPWRGLGDFGYFGPSHSGFFDGFHYGFGGLFGPMPYYRHRQGRMRNEVSETLQPVNVDQHQARIDQFQRDLQRSERRFAPKPWETGRSAPLFGESGQSPAFPSDSGAMREPFASDRQERRDANEPE